MTPPVLALTWPVVAAVLVGALLHASWNALVKSSGDKPLDTALVHLLGAWRVHLLDNEASTAAQEEPRFASLSGPLATPRQLSARTSTSHQ